MSAQHSTELEAKRMAQRCCKGSQRQHTDSAINFAFRFEVPGANDTIEPLGVLSSAI